MTHSWKVRLAACAALPLLALAGCTASPPDGEGEAPIEIAYLSASSANTYLAAARDAMEAIADEQNVKITEFDSKFELGVQATQIQDVISSGRYKGIILATIDGLGIAPAIQDAIDAGLEVVILNQTVGDDYQTSDPQVEGVAASVLTPPGITGERMGELTVNACADLDPCRVVFMYGIKGVPGDTAARDGFDSVITDHSAIQVIAEGEGGFLGTDEPFKATQDIIQAFPEFEVLVATSDQQARGALLALTDAGLTSVKVIGVGASTPALAAIADGTWYADVALAPADEGTAALTALLAAIRDGDHQGGIDPVTKLPDNGLVTKDNVSDFSPQWEG